jgi:hypothetical protein
MEGFESYEYVIKPKRDAKNKMMRIGLVALYVAFVIAWLVFGFISGFIPLLALIPVTTWMLVFFTWRYVNVEYEYVAESGVITFSKVYDNRSRKKIAVFDIRSAEYIAPASESETLRRVTDYDPKYEYSFVTYMDDPDAYTALYVNEDKERVAVSFIAHPRLKKTLKFYNSAASKIRM